MVDTLVSFFLECCFRYYFAFPSMVSHSIRNPQNHFLSFSCQLFKRLCSVSRPPGLITLDGRPQLSGELGLSPPAYDWAFGLPPRLCSSDPPYSPPPCIVLLISIRPQLFANASINSALFFQCLCEVARCIPLLSVLFFSLFKDFSFCRTEPTFWAFQPPFFQSMARFPHESVPNFQGFVLFLLLLPLRLLS